jgi:thioesterase domain-containing protein
MQGRISRSRVEPQKNGWNLKFEIGKRSQLLSLAEYMRSKVTEGRRKVYTVLRENRKSLTILPENARMVALQPAGERPAFFMVDSFENFIDLVKLIGTDQPVLCLIPREEALSEEYDINDEAAAHVKTILARQPHGPYMLGGFCAPGIVAFHIARQLQALGHEVGLLVLFDTANPYSKAWRVRAFMRAYSPFQLRPARLIEGFKIGSGEIPGWAGKLGGLIKKGKANLLQRAGREENYRALAPHVAAIAKHRPSRFSGRVLLIIRRLGIVRQYLDPQLGWGEAVRGKIETCLVNVPDHMGILKSELDRVLVAQKLKSCIDEVVEASSLCGSRLRPAQGQRGLSS